MSYALLFESDTPDAPQTLLEKSATLIRIADSYLRHQCNHTNAGSAVGRRQLNKRLAKMFDGVLKEQDLTFSEIKFLRVQEVIRKKGTQPPVPNDIDL